MKARDTLFNALIFVAPAFTIMSASKLNAYYPPAVTNLAEIVATTYTYFTVIAILLFTIFQHYQLSTGVEFQRTNLAKQLVARAGWLRWAVFGVVLMAVGLTLFSFCFTAAALGLLSLKLRSEDIAGPFNE